MSSPSHTDGAPLYIFLCMSSGDATFWFPRAPALHANVEWKLYTTSMIPLDSNRLRKYMLCAFAHHFIGNFSVSLDINFEGSQKSCTASDSTLYFSCSCKCCYIHKIFDPNHTIQDKHLTITTGLLPLATVLGITSSNTERASLWKCSD